MAKMLREWKEVTQDNPLLKKNGLLYNRKGRRKFITLIHYQNNFLTIVKSKFL